MKSFKPTSLLVTGGAGFIGANFIRYFLEKYKDVSIINVDKLTYAACINSLSSVKAEPNYHFIEADICNEKRLHDLLREHHVDAIIHFAAESHVDRSIAGPKEFINTNIIGTFNLLNEARLYWQGELELSQEQCRFHHISTDEVYGSLKPDDAAFTESSQYAPNSPYSASKASADHLVRACYHTYKLPVVTTNCSNNYGPLQHDEKFIPTVIRSCEQQKAIPVYGDGSNIRDWVYVDDHCRGLDMVLHNGQLGETYNIGGNAERSNIDVVKLICQEFNKRYPQRREHEALINYVTDRPGHDWRYAIDNTKINQQLGFKPDMTFVQGIHKTIDWYINYYTNE